MIASTVLGLVAATACARTLDVTITGRVVTVPDPYGVVQSWGWTIAQGEIRMISGYDGPWSGHTSPVPLDSAGRFTFNVRTRAGCHRLRFLAIGAAPAAWHIPVTRSGYYNLGIVMLRQSVIFPDVTMLYHGCPMPHDTLGEFRNADTVVAL